jgi:hypothetical protein
VLDISPIELVNKAYLNNFSKIYVNAIFSHLIIIYDYVNLAIFSSKSINSELYLESDIFSKNNAISQVIFDPIL